MTTTTRNEAAERLRMLILAIPNISPKIYQRTPDGPDSVAPFDPDESRRLLDEALATERRTTVERIRELAAIRWTMDGQRILYESDVEAILAAILDEEAQRSQGSEE